MSTCKNYSNILNTDSFINSKNFLNGTLCTNNKPVLKNSLFLKS